MLGFGLNKIKAGGKVVIIEILEERREEVLTILLKNGSFRSLSKNTFEIEKDAEETIEKIRKAGIEVKIIES